MVRIYGKACDLVTQPVNFLDGLLIVFRSGISVPMRRNAGRFFYGACAFHNLAPKMDDIRLAGNSIYLSSRTYDGRDVFLAMILYIEQVKVRLDDGKAVGVSIKPSFCSKDRGRNLVLDRNSMRSLSYFPEQASSVRATILPDSGDVAS